jgi:hypothetical protein
MRGIGKRLAWLEADSPAAAGKRCRGCGRLPPAEPCPWTAEELAAMPPEELRALHAEVMSRPCPLSCVHCGRPDDAMAAPLREHLGAEAAEPIIMAFASGDGDAAVRLLSALPRERLMHLWRASLRD